MLTLDYQHPAQLVLGAIMTGEEMATKNRQMTFATICNMAIGWAVETRDLLREIATDADSLNDDIFTVASDGIITPAERAHLSSRALEIRDEAVTGKIINTH